MEISLPGEQVLPLPKKANKNKKPNKNKPNGFICFANSQRSKLASQYNIRGPQMLVELCDPLWRNLAPAEKTHWNNKAKEEHARMLGRKVPGTTGTPATLRMDCNGKLICERQDAERAESERRVRERKLVQAELERCEEIVDKEFFIIDALTIIEYLEGECVPCEIAVVKCTIRSGIMGYYHFFPDPGPLRPGHFAEALERCELEHEIKPKDFSLASKDYEADVTKIARLLNLNSPKMPLLFARSSEAKKVESCLEWLGFRVDQEFRPKVMELESFVLDLVNFTKNAPPSFAQVRRLLFETKFDFVQGNRCDFHSQTDKVACSIGNVRKFFYFISEILYDYYDYDIVEGHHFPIGFENNSCSGSSRASYSVAPSVMDMESDFNDTMSMMSSISVGSYRQRPVVEPPRRPNAEYSASRMKKSQETPAQLSQVSNFSLDSFSTPNSFATALSSFPGGTPSSYTSGPNSFVSGRSSVLSTGASSPTNGVPLRRPNIPSKSTATYDTQDCGKMYNSSSTYDTQDYGKVHNSSSTYDTQDYGKVHKTQSVNSFCSTPSTTRSASPVGGLVGGDSRSYQSLGRSKGRGSQQGAPAVGGAPYSQGPAVGGAPYSQGPGVGGVPYSQGPGVGGSPTAPPSVGRGRSRAPRNVPRKPHTDYNQKKMGQ